MKHAIKTLSLIVMIGLLIFSSCSDDEPPALSLTALTASSIDLNGATSATNAPVDAELTATFSTDLDATSATDATVLLTRDFDGSAVAKEISVSGSTVTITPDDNLFSGDHYKLTFKTGLKSTGGKSLDAEIVRSFGTPGLGLGSAPQSSSQVLYIQFDNSIIDLTGNATKASEQVAYTTDRFGVANAAANFRGASANGNGDIVELSGTKFVNASTTISVWYKVALADYMEGGKFMFGTAVERGYFMEVGGELNWFKLATSHKVVGTPPHNFGTAWTDPNGDGTVGGQTLFDYTGSIQTLTKNAWVQLVMTYDATSSLKTIYINGTKIMQVDIDLDAVEWALKDLKIADKDDANVTIAGSDTKLALGYAGSKANTSTGWAVYADNQNTFKGAMDDFRIWTKALSSEEVTTLYNSEKP